MFVGRHSVVFYVAHFPLMTVVTQVSMGVDPHGNPVLPVINFAVALAISTGLAHARWLPLVDALFVLPLFLTRLLERQLVKMNRLLRRLIGIIPIAKRERQLGAQLCCKGA